ncbi:MAG: YihY/virulence factor BrkB family protein [Acidobacteriota bacterium]|nr:YihY/virulence factor BrkB family protein [Acidobacteriota bacterium]
MASMLQFFHTLRRAIWRGFEHDCFAIAKGAAYSAILTIFPFFLVIASVLALSHRTESFLGELSEAVGQIMPPDVRAAAQHYFEGGQHHPTRLIISASLITLMAASGVMISWMEGFRNAYRLPREWGVIKERGVALFLVLLSFGPMTTATILVGFGNAIQNWMLQHSNQEIGLAILLLWQAGRWIISTLTSIAVISLLYHWGIPRTQPFSRVLPGAVLATVAWFTATLGFGWYVTKFANYTAIYGSLGAAIALLVWTYIVSVVVLIGAEFNALVYPRVVLEEPKAILNRRGNPVGVR